MGAVVEDEDAAVAEPAATSVRTAQESRLGEHLGPCRGGGERGGLDDAGERGTTGGGVEEVVGGPAPPVEPAAPADAARRNTTGHELELVQQAPAERVVDPHDAREAVGAAEAEVAAAVHRVARGAGEGRAGEVREQPLHDPAAVEPDARRPSQDPAVHV